MTVTETLKELNSIIDAWESLSGNKSYSPEEIQTWLINEMSPAINNARKVINRKIPMSNSI